MGARRAHGEMFFDDPGLLRRQPAIEEVIEPAERLFAGDTIQ